MKRYNNNRMYCLNCGSKYHNKKECVEPITSYGIILLDIKTEDMYAANKLISSLKIPSIATNDNQQVIPLEKMISDTKHIDITNENSLKLFCDLKNNIKFLLIKRKHTLGYLEFIRGKYNLDNSEGIQFLFKQMITSEIKKIGTLTFNELWDDVWGNSYKNDEYYASKAKFNKLKTSIIPNIDFYVNNVVPLWLSQEWGFPKGRRSYNETDINCAVREFKEETGYLDDEFIVLNKVPPIEEVFYGTNGIKYKHVYYLAISMTDKSVNINNNNKHQCNEIGDIRWATFDDSMQLFRPYHCARKQLLTELFMYVINCITQCN